jgi:hypothetical protein
MILTSPAIIARKTVPGRSPRDKARSWAARLLILAMGPTAWWLGATTLDGWTSLGSRTWSVDTAVGIGIGLLGTVMAAYLALVSVPLLVSCVRRTGTTPSWLRACTPALWRRIVATAAGGALGLSLATATVAAPAADPSPPQAVTVTSAGWVAAAPLTPDAAHHVSPYVDTAVSLPRNGAAVTAPPDTTPTRQSAAQGTTSAPTVTVRRGDSLWAICAEILPDNATDKEIARAWPLMYGANRATIGDNPSLIYAGQTLEVPSELRS